MNKSYYSARCPLVLLIPFVLSTVSVTCMSSTQAGILQNYSGNTDAEATTMLFSDVGDFAVYDRLSGASSAGDVFGTGYSGFDALASEDPTARYLYLYELTVVSGSFGEFGQTNDAYGATSAIQVNLAFADNNGVVSGSNAFGSDTLNFQASAPANIGVTMPHLVASSGLIDSTVSLSGSTFTSNFVAPTGTTTELFGFTSNVPPTLQAYQSAPFIAGGTEAVPLPEPRSLWLALLGLGVGALCCGCRRAGRRRCLNIKPSAGPTLVAVES